MKNLSITVLDLASKNEFGGYNQLPSLTNLNDITDVNSVHSIRFEFTTKEESIQFLSQFPKTYKGKVYGGYKTSFNDQNQYTEEVYFGVSFHFNTFFTNETTGSTNESALQRRIKVINKLKSII